MHLCAGAITNNQNFFTIIKKLLICIKLFLMLKAFIIAAIVCPGVLMAQITPKKKLPLCNPLIFGNIPKKAISLQYEYQSKFNNESKNITAFPLTTTNVFTNNVSSFKLGFNKNVRVKPNGYISLDIGYTNTTFNKVTNANLNANPLPLVFNNTAFHAINTSTTVFKPLNDKHFLIINAGIELNGNTASLKKLGVRNIFASGVFMYGTKKSYNEMWAFGVARSYRLGRVIHVPSILWNKNFSKKWGMEMLLPSRLIFRYTTNKKTIFIGGVELEGNQFAVANNLNSINNSFLQRGEIRPKLGIETALTKNIRFIANAGVRVNGRFNLADNYDGKKLLLENAPKTNAFVNIGVGWLTIKKVKKK